MISIIIPVRNASRTLEACLESVRALLVQAEVIVVDDHSTDTSSEVARRFGARVIELGTESGAAAARNAGARAASGEILFFTDADVVLPREAMRSVEQHFEKNGAGPLVGLLSEDPGPKNLASAYKNLYMHYTYTLLPEQVSVFYTSAAAVRKEHFFAVGGFDENYAGASIEDLDIGERLSAAGYPARLDKGLQVLHLHHYTAWDVLTTAYRRARGVVRIMLRKRLSEKERARYQTSPGWFRASIAAALLALALFCSGAALGSARIAILGIAPIVFIILATRGLAGFVLRRVGRNRAPAFYLLLSADLLAHGIGAIAGIAGFVFGRRY